MTADETLQHNTPLQTTDYKRVVGYGGGPKNFKVGHVTPSRPR